MNWYHLLKFAQDNICNRQITLNPVEKKIFNLLLSAKKTVPELQNVEIRVAGGWTRDKLLGLESDDIDIALSNITGADFVQALRQFNQNPRIIGRVYLVEENIEKSKHLATAGIDLFGQKVEFVNLRSEEYGETRVPTMKMGTPEQDALRRDLTFNALFYNIETGKVEDYVGGCEDLQNMILRTPLDPAKTFKDDPLRMLRVLRFYSRYPNAEIEGSTLAAMSDPDVQSNYRKLAPERAAPELFKMMKGAKPAAAAHYLFETGLYKVVFDIPENFMDITESQRSHWHQLSLLNHTIAVMSNVNEIAQEKDLPDDERALLNLSALFHDFGKMDPEIRSPHPKRPGYFQYLGHEDVSTQMAKEIMTRMGFPADAKKFVSTVVGYHMKPHRNELFSGSRRSKQRLGKFLKDVDELYKMIDIHVLADELSKGELTQEEQEEIRRQKQKTREYTERYRQERGELISKPLLDGNEIRVILASITPELVNENGFILTKKYDKPVHYLAYAMDRLLEQQWGGSVKTPDQARQFVKDNARQWEQLWHQTQNTDQP